MQGHNENTVLSVYYYCFLITTGSKIMGIRSLEIIFKSLFFPEDYLRTLPLGISRPFVNLKFRNYCSSGIESVDI